MTPKRAKEIEAEMTEAPWTSFRNEDRWLAGPSVQSTEWMKCGREPKLLLAYPADLNDAYFTLHADDAHGIATMRNMQSDLIAAWELLEAISAADLPKGHRDRRQEILRRLREREG